MKINCNIANDLLPLYVDKSCSEDSRAALEEHLKECAFCRAKIDRMQSGVIDGIQMENSTTRLAIYAKKVRLHRIRTVALVVLITIFTSIAFALIYLTIRDMNEQASPKVVEVEAGTYNLTAGELETISEEVGQYIFYTNSAEISVTVQNGDDNFSGTIMLWDTMNNSEFIQIDNVSAREATCAFRGLSAARRYKITCDNLVGETITVSGSPKISFWNSLKSVLNEITRG